MLVIALTALGAAGSIVGIWAFVDARRNKRIKLLAWERARAASLASASRADSDYKLSILFERPGSEPEVIEGAYATYLRFANFGREPIRRGDIAEANPLRIEVEVPEDKGRVLDIYLAASSRDVIKLELGGLVNSGGVARAAVEFDFLDHEDGGVVRVLSSGWPKSVKLKGDIIGMPDGLTRSDVAAPATHWTTIGLSLLGLAEVGAMVLSVVWFHRVTGVWADAWLLLLPPGLAIVVLFLGGGVAALAFPRRPRKFPTELALPSWYGFRQYMEVRGGVYHAGMDWADGDAKAAENPPGTDATKSTVPN
jgi:hypothetical protein